MVAQNVFHRASSYQIMNLWRFADRCNIPWNPPTIFHPDLIATVPQMSLPWFCALLFRQSHLFLICDLCGVDVKWFQERSAQALPNSWELSVCMTFGFFVSSKIFCKLFSVSWEVLFMHGSDCIHWAAKSYTTTAYQWLCRDSHPHQELCDPLWSSHQNVPLLARVYQGVFCKEPL